LNAVRMLTLSEIESLRQHKRDTAAFVKTALAVAKVKPLQTV
jgi:hypothetical protein